VGKSKASVTFSTTRLSSLTVGPRGATGAFEYAAKDKWTLYGMIANESKITEEIKKETKNFVLYIYSLSLIIVD
jgi:hypothetical protein